MSESVHSSPQGKLFIHSKLLFIKGWVLRCIITGCPHQFIHDKWKKSKCPSCQHFCADIRKEYHQRVVSSIRRAWRRRRKSVKYKSADDHIKMLMIQSFELFSRFLLTNAAMRGPIGVGSPGSEWVTSTDIMTRARVMTKYTQKMTHIAPSRGGGCHQ